MLAKAEYSKLWSEACGGDVKSYSELHSRLFSGLFEYARKIVKDDDVANDLIQELFVKLWTKRASIGEIDNVRAYLLTSIRCSAINYIKRQKLTEAKVLQLELQSVQFSVEDLITSRETHTILKKRIGAAINKLPGRQREMIYLRYFEELDYQQIVELTGLKYQSVLNHIYRAVQMLKDEFRSTNRCAA